MTRLLPLAADDAEVIAASLAEPGWSLQGSRAMNIFDPASYAYLGMTTRGEQDQGGDALFQTAVVSYPGQAP
jgi:hypothetical protein